MAGFNRLCGRCCIIGGCVGAEGQKAANFKHLAALWAVLCPERWSGGEMTAASSWAARRQRAAQVFKGVYCPVKRAWLHPVPRG